MFQYDFKSNEMLRILTSWSLNRPMKICLCSIKNIDVSTELYLYTYSKQNNVVVVDKITLTSSNCRIWLTTIPNSQTKQNRHGAYHI